MSLAAVTSLGLAGTIAGIPVAALAYAVPDVGPVHLPERWWTGGPAKPTQVVIAAAVTGAAAATVGTARPPDLALPAFWAFAVAGMGLSIIDLRCRRLPHRFVAALWILSAICFTLAAIAGRSVEPLVRAIGAGSVTAAAMLLIALALPGQLGLGDVHLAGAIAMSLGWIGWQAALVGVLSGLLIQAAVAVTQTMRRTVDTLQPMGPALVAGWLVAIAVSG